MVSTASALDRNANAGAAATSQPPAQPKRKLPLVQETLVREFTQHYDIRADQIWFDGDKDQPYFDFEALSTLVNELSDIPAITVEPAYIDYAIGIVTASCEVKLKDGRTRQVFGTALLGETMHDGTIADARQALDVAQARAFRKVLRTVSFDPVRAHNARQNGEELPLKLGNDLRQKELAEIHMIAKSERLITSESDEPYRRFMRVYFPDIASARDMNDSQRSQWLGILRGVQKAHERAAALESTPQV